ncbi:hypothetical protein V6N12_065568 [Hibiscus sabdariffa]|uniref:Putative plant transposon protein domain-containing protein n=1 Tax=Hibiscus sabdariffa TaxID=183260 RepID=A0ABR2G930_9ROSI
MPNYAKFLKDMVSRKKRIEEFETAAATETCLALMHTKIPAKKTDLGSFTIECSIGHNYSTKALCDPGASINLMPKSVFQKLNIGEAKPTTVMLQLADHSFVQPEGKIEDILVQVDKFIFPANFLILDCEADENAPIILGRPFLSTSRAMIDFDKDEIVFKVDDDQVNMKALKKQLEQKNKGKGIDTTPTEGTQRLKPYMAGSQLRVRKRVCRFLGTWQPARANLNWVLEFYTSNAAGEDTVTVRGRRVPANSDTINNILDLPNDSPGIYELIDVLEEEDLDTIKDQLCEPGTAWNVRGKNPKTISRPHLQPEAKLWNTFVKRNLMPTSHNQTVDHTRLVLINAIITGYKFNVGEVIARELSAACQNDKGILAFPYLISALCRRAAVPAQPADKYTPDKTGWTCKEYMWKMEIADVVPIQMAMLTPLASEQPEPVAPAGRAPSPAATPPADHATSPAPTPTATPATQDSRQSTPASPMGSTPTPPPSPPPAQSEEAAPIHILQLRSQLQRIEAR